MTALNEELNIKRHHLIAECEQQRQKIALYVNQMQQPLSNVNKALDVVLVIKKHPWILLGVLFFMKKLRRKGSKQFLIPRIFSTLIKIKLFSSWLSKLKTFIQNASSFDR